MINNKKLELSENMYKEEILDHYKNPRNFGELKGPAVLHREINPLCGDKIKLSLKIDSGKLKDIKFSGNGCAISQAAISMLTEKVKGMNLNEIKKLDKKDIFNLLGIPISAARIKCALLSLDTLKNSIKIYEHKQNGKN
ncbi:MAG: Fe-S cluster assembly sulfur transfer protein SufU [archaeon]